MHKNTLTGRAFSDAFLELYRHLGDSVADEVIEQLAIQGGFPAVGTLMKFLTDYEKLDVDDQSNSVRNFITSQIHTTNLLENKEFANGIQFFWKHFRVISFLLGTYSLPYCYAGANGAQVLWLSERIRTKTIQRLEETGAFVFGIMQEKDWINGLNFRRVAKIRLLHAAIRWFTLHSGKWNPTWGHPVCQEDMAGTNLSFSFIILKGLRKLNISISTAEENSFLYFWNVIGRQLGLQEELLPQNMLEAYRLDRAIAKRQFRTSEAGIGLTSALLKAIEQQIPSPGLQNIPAAHMRFFLGKETADLLGVPQAAWEERFVKIAMQSTLFPQLLSLQTPDSPVLERYWR
ncbi:oxygenase MpaB family protein [Arundinibacter roseus]|uniref:DUF2236 domain-containing protein n=1 Tax=Arundinibacter roseus TaxID=2070510 RepID=A0A4R4KFZ4_9BACT|nr:oxygenase MpaB family protein [Arundinibacter roseus]TDB66940.1 DUF2236 domain-containing protein [Arundinibacter roseus]